MATPSTSIDTIHEGNKESITIIWFDTEIGTLANEATIEQRLREINDCVRLFSNQEQCLTYIRSLQHERIILMTSGKCAAHFLPHVTRLPLVDSVFIFCFRKSNYMHLKDKFPKIVGVFVNFELLHAALKKTVGEIDHQLQTFAVFERHQQAARDLSKDSAEFLWFQLAKDIIMNLPRGESSKTEMLEKCRQYYRNNVHKMKQIDEFESSYKPEDVILWYTKQSFVYELINKALRCEDIDQLLQFRFFIFDLCARLADEHNKLLQSGTKLLTAFRGTKLHKNELERFNLNVGELIAANGFWSTSRNRGRARLFATDAPQNNDVTPVLFQITCDVQTIGNSAVFSDIGAFSQHPNEEEVLFDLSTCFRIDGVDLKQDIPMIKLSVCGAGHQIAQDYFKEKRSEIEIGKLEFMLGILWCEMGQYEKSLNHFQRLLCVSVNDDPAWIQLNIGRALYYQGKLDEAKQHYDQAYDRMMGATPQRVRDSATVLNNIGIILQDQGDLDKAQEYHKKALKIREELLAPDHPDITCSMTNMGNILHAQGKHNCALELHRKVLSIYERRQKANHPDYAISLNNIGNILADQANYAEAQKHHKRALNIRRNILSSNHPDIADSYNNIGDVLHKQGKYNEALESHRKAHEIRERCLPLDHPKTADSLNNIGSVLESQKKYDEALGYYRRALAMRQKCLPDKHPAIAYTHNNIGNVLSEQNNYAEALEQCNKALQMQTTYRVPQHLDIAASHNNIGNILQKQRELVKADSHYRQALDIREKNLPEQHPDIADSLNNIGLNREIQKNYDEALTHYHRSLAIKENCFSLNHPSIAVSCHNIANVLRLQDRHTECLSYYLRSYKIRKAYLPCNDPDIADDLYCIGRTYAELKQSENALDYLKQAAKIYNALPNESARSGRIAQYILQMTALQSHV